MGSLAEGGGNLRATQRTNNGGIIVIASGGTLLQGQYSSTYNIANQFYVPRININPVSNFSTGALTPIQNDFFISSNTIFENVYIKT